MLGLQGSCERNDRHLNENDFDKDDFKGDDGILGADSATKRGLKTHKGGKYWKATPKLTMLMVYLQHRIAKLAYTRLSLKPRYDFDCC